MLPIQPSWVIELMNGCLIIRAASVDRGVKVNQAYSRRSYSTITQQRFKVLCHIGPCFWAQSFLSQRLLWCFRRTRAYRIKRAVHHRPQFPVLADMVIQLSVLPATTIICIIKCVIKVTVYLIMREKARFIVILASNPLVLILYSENIDCWSACQSDIVLAKLVLSIKIDVLNGGVCRTIIIITQTNSLLLILNLGFFYNHGFSTIQVWRQLSNVHSLMFFIRADTL